VLAADGAKTYGKLGLHLVKGLAGDTVRDLKVCVRGGFQDAGSLLLGRVAGHRQRQGRHGQRENDSSLCEEHISWLDGTEFVCVA